MTARCRLTLRRQTKIFERFTVRRAYSRILKIAWLSRRLLFVVKRLKLPAGGGIGGSWGEKKDIDLNPVVRTKRKDGRD